MKKIVSTLLAVLMVVTMFAGLSLPISATGADVAIDSTNFPDENFRTYVGEEFDTNDDGTLSQQERDDVTEINVYKHGITTLAGIEHFTALTTLHCGENQITVLNVSNNTSLTNLFLYDNALTTIDVTMLPNLVYLDCGKNNLSEIDTSENSLLETFYCQENNQLSTIDISNNTALKMLVCCNNESMTALNVNNNALLKNLNCKNTQTTSLDLSHNSLLTELNCSNTNITNIDLSHNSLLTELNCSNTNITNIDLSHNPALRILRIEGMALLSSIDLSHNTELAKLYSTCSGLTSLDLSQNEKLVIIICSNCNISSLVLPNSVYLQTLYCEGNRFATLDLSNCDYPTLLEFKCNSDYLTNLCMGDNDNVVPMDTMPAATITYHDNIGIIETQSHVLADFTTAISEIPENTPSGFVFVGWYPEQEAVANNTYAPERIKAPRETIRIEHTDTNYYAVYENEDTVQRVTLTHSENETATTSIDSYAGHRIVLGECDLSKIPNEYVFLGWTEQPYDTNDTLPTDILYPGDKYTLPYTDSYIYALYAKGTGDYVRVMSDRNNWEGQYIIASKREDGGYCYSTKSNVLNAGKLISYMHPSLDIIYSNEETDKNAVTVIKKENGYEIQYAESYPQYIEEGYTNTTLGYGAKNSKTFDLCKLLGGTTLKTTFAVYDTLWDLSKNGISPISNFAELGYNFNASDNIITIMLAVKSLVAASTIKSKTIASTSAIKYSPAYLYRKDAAEYATYASYSVVYDANTDETVENLPPKCMVKSGTSVELTMADPIREGYKFMGWGLSEDSADAVDEVVIQNGDVEVYAIWDQLPEDIEDPSSYMKIASASLTMKSDLSINFKVYDSSIENVSDIYMKFTKELYNADGSVSATETTDKAEYTIGKDTKGTYRIYSLTDINATEMNSKVTATLYGTYGDKVCRSKTVTYSVATYAMNMLRKSNDTALKKTLVDMLNYGTAAQTYFEYDMTRLANAGLSEEQRALGSTQTNGLPTDMDLIENAGATATFTMATLSLNERVTMNIYLDGDCDFTTTEAHVTYETPKGTKTDIVDGSLFAYSEDNGYAIVYSGMTAIQMRTVCTFEIFDKTTGNRISDTVTYSIASYAERYAEDENVNLANVVNMMMRYGDSAKAFAEQ